jgi:hypothetical protein
MVSGARARASKKDATMSSVRSAKQFRYMKAVESGKVKDSGLTKEQAKEFTQGQSPKNLPEKVKKKD